MKFSTIRSAAAALFLLLPCTAPAQKDPESVNRKSDRALQAKPALKAAAKPQGAPVVGSSFAPPARTLGTAKPECVYKPVMTDEEINNCR